MNEPSFVAFILSHGRPKNVQTYAALRRQGYTGRIVIVIDNEDKHGPEYISEFGKESVVVFDKAAISETFDEADNFCSRANPVYARNACFEIAKKLGYRYFVELDDDYRVFYYRRDAKLNYCEIEIKNLDRIFDALLDFFKAIPAESIAIAQSGDFMGGKNGDKGLHLKLLRKAMNSFICDTERPFKFCGGLNDHVNTYVSRGMRGSLFLTVPNVLLRQGATQAHSGGITETYLKFGTYVKSFYTIMYAPSCVTIVLMGATNLRLHHKITWKNAVPKIVSESLRK
jgi:hypothetical protein